MDSLRVTDDASKAVQKTPNRVALDDMEAKVASVEFYNPANIPHMTVAVLVMKNGYAVLGKSAPADPDNYDEEHGRRLAREDAMRKIWPLEGYALRERLQNSA